MLWLVILGLSIDRVAADSAAPQITTQPQSQTVIAGSDGRLSVTAVGDNLCYQWWCNGARLLEATNASHTIRNFQAANAGSYQVVVLNSSGSIKSAVVSLTLGAPPSITTQPTSQMVAAGACATFSVTGAGNNLAYQWWFNGARVAGGTNASYMVSSVQAINTGSYQVVVSNPYGSVSSRVVGLTIVTPPVIAVQPYNQKVVNGSCATFAVTASGGGLSYQWWFNGTCIPQGTNASYVMSAVQPCHAGSYAVVVSNGAGKAVSAVVQLSVTDRPPAIAVQPQNLIVDAGSAATLSAIVTGDNLVYQWWCNGAKIPGGTNAWYAISNAQLSNAGNYALNVSNAAGSMASRVVTLSLSPGSGSGVSRPRITLQPQSQAVPRGSTVTLSTAVSGDNLAYQWSFNGTKLPRGTNAWYAIPNFQDTNVGNYQLVTFNAAGSAASVVARLSIVGPDRTPPSISLICSQSTDQNSPLGPLSFSISGGCSSASALTLWGKSSDTNLVPKENIVFTRFGEKQTVTIFPAADRTGNCYITIMVADSTGALASSSFALSVNLAQLANAGLPVVARAYEPFSYQPFSTQVSVNETGAGGATEVSPLVLPSWLSLDRATLTLSGTPPAGGPEGDLVRLSVSDGVSTPAIKEFRIWTADFIGLTNAVDVAAKREALINYIWGADGWPTEGTPAEIQTGISDDKYASLYNAAGNLARIDQYTIRMAYGLESKVYHYLPQRSNGRLFIVHAGHNPEGFVGDDINMNALGVSPGLVIPALLKEGYSVLGFSMPVFNPGGPPTVNLPGVGNVVLSSHESMLAYLDRPFRFFLEPIVVALNHVEDNYGYRHVYMTGLSGGGWTTTVYAALDPRIERSFPVAGSVPNYLRVGYEGLGDAEQDDPGFYRIANYEELYVMGSYGPNRGQLQILNLYDACCFYGHRYTNWVGAVRSKVVQLGLGRYDFYLDTTHHEHKISTDAVRVILNALPPTIDEIDDRTVEMNSGAQTVLLTGIRPASPARTGGLSLSAVSDNPALTGNLTVNYFSPDSTGRLSFTPQANATGVAHIVVTVKDGISANACYTLTFKVTVTSPAVKLAMHDAATGLSLTDPADQTALVIRSAAVVTVPGSPPTGSMLEPANHQFELQIAGPDGKTVVVEASTDLNNWVSISTNTVVNGAVIGADSESGKFPLRFYRARLGVP